jgi:hypothetical protein
MKEIMIQGNVEGFGMANQENGNDKRGNEGKEEKLPSGKLEVVKEDEENSQARKTSHKVVKRPKRQHKIPRFTIIGIIAVRAAGQCLKPIHNPSDLADRAEHGIKSADRAFPPEAAVKVEPSFFEGGRVGWVRCCIHRVHFPTE